MTNVRWPLQSNVIRRSKESNTFGRFPQRTSGVHWGWDFYAVPGTPCFAVADGKIAMVYGNASDTDNFGLVVVLKFTFEGETLYAAYCHLSAASVSTGDSVTAGEQLGRTGNSGNAISMRGLDQHLHFELRSSARPAPGGLPLRMSPLKIFGTCPLNAPVIQD